MICTCVRCGKQFEARCKTAVCSDCKTSVCVVCGKEFTLAWPYTSKTCSSKCRGIYRKQSGLGKKVAQKSLNTKQMRYGTVDPHKLYHGGIIKKCKWCGKEFEASDPRQEYCKDTHYGKCPVCGKQVVIKDYAIGAQTCSPECRTALINKTCLERYGNKDAVNSEHAKKLAREHCIDKYGVPYYSATDEFLENYKKRMNELYGVDFPLQNPEILQKIQDTNLKKYGCKNPMQNREIKEKSVNRHLELYHGIGFGSPITGAKIQKTNVELYGCVSPIQSEEIKAKSRKTCLEKYGAPSFMKSDAHIQEAMTDSSKFRNYKLFLEDPKSFIENNYEDNVSIAILCHDLGVTDTPIYDALVKHNCSYLIHKKMSSMEYDILDLFKSLGITVIHNTKKIITPYELDIYLPEYDFAVECNPTVTHNSSFCDPWNQLPKSPSYHKMKTDMCEDKGVQLFHIFGYEWASQKSIILSMLKNRVGVSDTIYGRNTYVCELAYDESCKFLDKNHRQGSLSAPIRLGLRSKDTDELLAVMTFGKLRNSMGAKDGDSNNCYELSRFCNKLGTSIVGGASKLLKYFLQHYEVHKVVSFSDRAHTSGKLYSTLGFHKVSQSDPGYIWVNIETDEAINRVNCQKRNLRKLFKDDTIDIENFTERQIMESRGFARVFDSGLIRWELDI